jgi:hypothetical protein
MCFRRQLKHDVWPIQLTFSIYCMYDISVLLDSNNNSFLTPSVQMISSILLQHRISELSRYFWSTSQSVQVSAPYKPYLFTYSMEHRVLLEKLTGSAASQEIPCIFGTRRFLTVLTSARHLSLSWTNSIQSPQPRATSWRSILILSSHLRLGLPNGLLLYLYVYNYI